jgi:hypothetical protein
MSHNNIITVGSMTLYQVVLVLMTKIMHGRNGAHACDHAHPTHMQHI